MKSQEAVSISELKAKALRLLDRVAKTGHSLIVTRRGKPLVRVVPISDESDKPVPGRLAHTVLHEGDIVSPLGPDDWDAAR